MGTEPNAPATDVRPTAQLGVAERRLGRRLEHLVAQEGAIHTGPAQDHARHRFVVELGNGIRQAVEEIVGWGGRPRGEPGLTLPRARRVVERASEELAPDSDSVICQPPPVHEPPEVRDPMRGTDAGEQVFRSDVVMVQRLRELLGDSDRMHQIPIECLEPRPQSPDPGYSSR
jgi:hypothetical protein